MGEGDVTVAAEPSQAVAGHDVDEHPALLLPEHLERPVEVARAGAGAGLEDVADEALGVHPHEHVLGTVHVAADEREVVRVGEEPPEADDGELAERGREPGARDALDELVVLAAQGDHGAQGHDREPLLLGDRAQLLAGRATSPSSAVTIESSAAGWQPASRTRSTAASVRPARWRTPPGRARSGCT